MWLFIQVIILKFLKFLERHHRLRIILDRKGKRIYMKRYYLLFNGKKKTKSDFNRPFNAMLHHILLSDEEDLHDHPWWYFALIFKGGYWETTPKGRFWRGPGYFTFRRATSFHRIEVKEGGSWSLFIRGKPKRNWGFMVNNEWIPNEKYLEKKLRREKLFNKN